MKKLSMDNMERYLQSYDVLRQKYFWDMDDIPAMLIKQAVSLDKKHKASAELWNYDKAHKAYRTVRKVYDDESTNHLGILQIASDKFIGDFVGIEGVEQLFAPSYFYFEWMMHLEYSMDRLDYINYRDHYIHQIKNLYEMLVLLDDYGFMDYCIESYQRNSNPIANQIKSGIEKQIQMADGQERALFKQITMRTKNNKSHGEVQKRMQTYCYRYLIHAVSIVAALTHDIGYPITYMLRTTKNLHSFLPLSEAFLHLNDAMPHLEEILQGSLLYQTVDSKEIAGRIKDKEDHGAVSAVILLSKYYETGAIYHLEPIERMVIELAAVVVYNHTIKYQYMTGNKELRYRNLFEENPISYLFRLCDDLQEWGRVYFDVSKRSNFLICPRCHMPINRDNRNKLTHISYSCACGISGVRRTQFPYRKLTNISACDALEITEVDTEDGRKRLKISMNYNLVSLLQLSLYNPRFAQQRADGVYELRRMLDGQRFIPDVYIETFLTNNPIAIKARCLEQYLKHMNVKNTSVKYFGMGEYWLDESKIISGEYPEEMLIENMLRIALGRSEEWDSYMATGIIQSVCTEEGWKNDRQEHLWRNIKDKWQQNLQFYYSLLVIGTYIDKYRKAGYLQDRDYAIGFAEQMADKISRYYSIQDRPTTVLIMDYIWQRMRDVSETEFFDHKVRHYYEESMLSNQFMINTVEDYVESDTYNKVKEKLKMMPGKTLDGIYDFYSDYELFSAMAQHSEL